MFNTGECAMWVVNVEHVCGLYVESLYTTIAEMLMLHWTVHFDLIYIPVL